MNYQCSNVSTLYPLLLSLYPLLPSLYPLLLRVILVIGNHSAQCCCVCTLRMLSIPCSSTHVRAIPPGHDIPWAGQCVRVIHLVCFFLKNDSKEVFRFLSSSIDHQMTFTHSYCTLAWCDSFVFCLQASPRSEATQTWRRYSLAPPHGQTLREPMLT